jgi:RNA polymerase sigma-70 factor (ECF subfamily)
MAERGGSASDEAILASLDAAPAAFAGFYRRHAGRLLSELGEWTDDERLAAELLAETFAAALAGARRFDPGRGSAADWLDALADAEIAYVRRNGVPRDRARGRLGLPSLEPGEAFLADLEEELVEAARFVAGRRTAARRALPRPPRAAPAVVAAGALVALVAVLALRGGAADAPAPGGRAAAAPLPDDVRFRLPAMQPLRDCGQPDEVPFRAQGGIALLRRPQRDGEQLPFAPGHLPIATFDARSTRRVSGVRVVPSADVSAGGRCGEHVGPGLCLVARGRFRCFTAVEVEWGRAVARTASGTLVGIAPDGVGSVTISDDGESLAAAVTDNVYRARAGFPAGEGIAVAFERAGGGCERRVAPELLAEVALLLDRPRSRERLPAAAGTVLDGEPVADAARYWGGGDGVDFWAVPVVPAGRSGCAPATRVCIVAVAGSASAAAECGRRRAWRQLFPERSLIFGTVPDGVTGVRAVQGGRTAEVSAHDNVYGGVLPFPYQPGEKPRLELLRGDDDAGRLAGLVDAGGPVREVLGRLRARGYLTLELITPAGEIRGRSIVYWWPGRAGFEEAQELARDAGIDEVEPIRDTDRIPRPVLETHAPFVVVVGS